MSKQFLSPPRAVSAADAAAKGMRPIVIGMIINMILALGKGAGGYMGNSYALIADALDSLTDVVSSAMIYVGLKIAAHPPDSDHPYGHGKAEPIAATLAALGLMGAAFTIAWQSLDRLNGFHSAPAPFTLLVLAIVVLVKQLLSRYVLRVGEAVQSTALKADAWHHRSDALVSAFAFVGISIAIIGGKGYESADAWAALLASVVIAFNGYLLLRTAVGELMDTAPDKSFEVQLRNLAQAVPGVMGLDVLLIRKMGLDFYVDLHVIVDGDLPVREGHRIAHLVKDVIRAAHPAVADVLVHVEPARVGTPL